MGEGTCSSGWDWTGSAAIAFDATRCESAAQMHRAQRTAVACGHQSTTHVYVSFRGYITLPSAVGYPEATRPPSINYD